VSIILNKNLLEKATRELAGKFLPFRKILDQFGIPPMWDRPVGFSTLLYIILEQQVSLASARATYEKLAKKLGNITPKNFLTLNDEQLKKLGFSWQKTKYGRIVAQKIIDRELNLEQLEKMPDVLVKETLMAIKGIGHWTSDIYLLMVLLRADIWPHGDRALAVAACEVFNMTKVPDYKTLQDFAVAWKPWRSVAARLLWHHYLNTNRKK